jgi:site-specific DNA recombinase
MTTPKVKMRAAGYTRVSSEIQVKGYSLRQQEAAITDFCRQRKHKLVEIFTDPGKSGADIQGRCGLKRLLIAAERGEFEVVVVMRLDRLSRDLYHCLWIEKELKKFGVEVVSIEQDTSGLPVEMATAFRQIIGVFAELDKNMSVRKMAQGKARKFKEGGGPVCGQISYGFKTDGPRGNRRLVSHPEEYPTLQYMMKLQSGGLSYAQITERLNSEGIPARTGVWVRQKVWSALNSHHLQGKVMFQGHIKWAAGTPDFSRKSDQPSD